MTLFTYVLSYNTLAANFSQNQLYAFISKNRDINSWYLAFNGTYVLKSYSNLHVLTESFRPFFDGAAYLLTYAVPNFMSGSLPAGVWEWMNSDPARQLGEPVR